MPRFCLVTNANCYKDRHCILKLESEFDIRMLGAQQADSAPVFNTAPHRGTTEWIHCATLGRRNTMLTTCKRLVRETVQRLMPEFDLTG